MQRALVLGGGGVIGVAWETGVLFGLLEGGFDPRQMDVFVGTSAGAITGSALAAGQLPPGPGTKEATERNTLPLDPTKLDPKVLGAVFARWAKMELTTIAEAAGIGALAASVNRDGEASWVEHVTRMLGVSAWPTDKRLLVNTVDTASGARRVLDRASGVELGRAVAASSAVPGLFPSVTIGGVLYMDGQVHSSTNADALLAFGPFDVLVAMPTNSVTAPGIGAHAERMLAAEITALEAQGSRVRARQPRSEDGPRLGRNLMDPTKAGEAYRVGLETGVAWAAELR